MSSRTRPATMSQHMTPIETLMNWFDNLAVDLRQQIASLVFLSLPSELYEAEPDDDDAADKYSYTRFGERLARWGGGMPSRQVGIVVAVAGMIDLIMLNRGAREDWNEARQDMEEIRKEPELAEFAQENLDQIALRQRWWIQAAKYSSP